MTMMSGLDSRPTTSKFLANPRVSSTKTLINGNQVRMQAKHFLNDWPARTSEDITIDDKSSAQLGTLDLQSNNPRRRSPL